MKFLVGQRWAVRRFGVDPDFDFVIVAPGTKPDRKICRVEWMNQYGSTHQNFEQEYTHEHIKRCAILIEPGVTEEQIMATAQQRIWDDTAFDLLIEVVQLSRSGKEYKKILPDLKLALKKSRKAADMCSVMIANLEGK